MGDPCIRAATKRRVKCRIQNIKEGFLSETMDGKPAQGADGIDGGVTVFVP